MKKPNMLRNDLLSMMAGENLKDLGARYLAGVMAVDEIEILDLLRDMFRRKILETICELDYREVRQGVIIHGLILAYYATKWNQPDIKMIFVRLSRAAYQDQLGELLQAIPKEKAEIRGALISRIPGFDLSTNSDNSTARYWFMKACDLLFKKINVLNEYPETSITSDEEIFQPENLSEIDALIEMKFFYPLSDYSYSEIIGAHPTALRELVEHNRIILTGNQETGKTTLARHLAMVSHQLQLNNDPLIVYIDALECTGFDLKNKDIFEIICDLKFQDSTHLRKAIMFRLKQMNADGLLLVILDNFDRVHKYTGFDISNNKFPLLTNEQILLLNMLGNCNKLIITALPSNAQSIIDVIQTSRESQEGSREFTFFVANLGDHEICYKKIFESRWARWKLPENENRREHTFRRYGLFSLTRLEWMLF